MPSSPTTLSNYAFYNCTSLRQISLDNVTWIGNRAFQNCSSLNDISLENVTWIGEIAFHSCSSLTQVTIPEGVTDIWRMTFYNCYALTDIVIPQSVVNIDNYNTFGNCHSLTSVHTIPNSYAATYQNYPAGVTVKTSGDITYADTFGALNPNPTTYEYGVGVASFAPLPDRDGYTFIGWSIGSIASTDFRDKTVTALWRPVPVAPSDSSSNSSSSSSDSNSPIPPAIPTITPPGAIPAIGDTGITIQIPEGATGLSKSTVNKIIKAADGMKITLELTSVRDGEVVGGITLLLTPKTGQILTGLSFNTKLTKSVEEFIGEYWDTKILGSFETAQKRGWGATATLSVGIEKIGFEAEDGTKLYALIYDTKTKKLYQVDAIIEGGNVIFKTTRSGIVTIVTEPVK
jgi:hypothetical protein